MEIAGFEFTEHARSAIGERGIELAWLARVLARPDRTERDRHDPALRHALGHVTERGDRVLRVIYNASVTPPRIVTAYFDRREKGRA